MAPTEQTCFFCKKVAAKFLIIRYQCEESCKYAACEICAPERIKLFSNSEFDIAELAGISRYEPLRREKSFSCSLCSMTLAELIANKRPGCGFCYDAFPDEIQSCLQEVQSRTRHHGKFPNQ